MSFLKRLFGGKPAPELPTIELPKSRGFPLDVVGESNYQTTIERICGPRTREGEDRVVNARLVLEDANPYDANAVRVEINGQRVGYLSRENAPVYRAWLAAHGHGQVIGACQAKIKGGWQRGDDVGHYGVYLSVKL